MTSKPDSEAEQTLIKSEVCQDAEYLKICDCDDGTAPDEPSDRGFVCAHENERQIRLSTILECIKDIESEREEWNENNSQDHLSLAIQLLKHKLWDL